MKLTNASLAVLLAAALGACGGLDSSERVLSTGEVNGRLSNATAPANAYAYVFGHPELRAPLADDGSFKLEHVPLGAGTARIVVYDGGDIGQGKAELVDVEVKPAGRTHLEDRNAEQMPLAGSIVAAVSCSGNQRGDGARYKVDGTEFEFDDRHKGERVTIFPVPEGEYIVQAALPGLKGSPKVVRVARGASALGEVQMDSDEGDSRRGCVSTQCSGNLLCDADDGRCYQCTKQNGSITGCTAVEDCENHVCVPDGNHANDGRSACLPCNLDTQCAPVGGGRCVGGTCTRACNVANGDADCPSGFACSAGACVAAGGCAAVLEAFGRSCMDDDPVPNGCSASLADAKCFGLDKKKAIPGYCTSRCGTDEDCPRSIGYACNGGYCTR